MAALSNDPTVSDLPSVFCWTKFGDEAGEEAPSIFERKELERRKNGGVFLWGIGQSIRPSLLSLLKVTRSPEVVFTPMRVPASPRDAAPEKVLLWYAGVGYDGQEYRLPRFSVVTSRWSNRAIHSGHFALVCERHSPLLDHPAEERIFVSEVRNLLTGSLVGSSQVTSVVVRVTTERCDQGGYTVVSRARLVYPYFVWLNRNIPIPDHERLDSLRGHSLGQGFDALIHLKESIASTAMHSQPLF